MRPPLSVRVWQGFRLSWRFVREVSGDDAYERYLVHHAGAHPDRRPMTRKQFYKLRQEQKWNRVTRCC